MSNNLLFLFSISSTTEFFFWKLCKSSTSLPAHLIHSVVEKQTTLFSYLRVWGAKAHFLTNLLRGKKKQKKCVGSAQRNNNHFFHFFQRFVDYKNTTADIMQLKKKKKQKKNWWVSVRGPPVAHFKMVHNMTMSTRESASLFSHLRKTSWNVKKKKSGVCYH